jgi:MFS family permease
LESQEPAHSSVIAGEPVEASRSRGLFSALTHRDYAIFWSGALVSNIGNWIQTTALMWYVHQTTGSNSWVAAVNLAAYLPVLLFVLFAGLVADAYNRKKIVIVAVAVQMVCALALAFGKTFNVLSLALILASVFVAGTAYTLSAPAAVSFLPELVPEEDMTSALSLSTAQFNVGRVVGPALGALILSAWSVSGAFYLNALSFIAVIFAFSIVRPRRPQIKVPMEHALTKIGDGFRLLLKYPWRIAVLLSLGAATFFGFSCTVLFPALANQTLHGGSGTYGLLMSMLGIGAAAGAPLVTWLHRSVPERSVIKWSCLGLGVSLAVLSLVRATWLAAVVCAVLGCCYLMMGASVNTVIQARSERPMRGRMVSMYSLMWLGMFSIGGQAVGYVADAWKLTAVMMVGGIVCVVVAGVLFAAPGMTRGAESSLGVEA